jgi:hypothetical protein
MDGHETLSPREERIVKAILVDQFDEAAKAYAAEFLREGETNWSRLWRLRERFVNSYAMLVTE